MKMSSQGENKKSVNTGWISTKMSDFYQNWNWYMNENATVAVRSDRNNVRTILMEEGIIYEVEEMNGSMENITSEQDTKNDTVKEQNLDNLNETHTKYNKDEEYLSKTRENVNLEEISEYNPTKNVNEKSTNSWTEPYLHSGTEKINNVTENHLEINGKISQISEQMNKNDILSNEFENDSKMDNNEDDDDMSQNEEEHDLFSILKPHIVNKSILKPSKFSGIKNPEKKSAEYAHSDSSNNSEKSNNSETSIQFAEDIKFAEDIDENGDFIVVTTKKKKVKRIQKQVLEESEIDHSKTLLDDRVVVGETKEGYDIVEDKLRHKQRKKQIRQEQVRRYNENNLNLYAPLDPGIQIDKKTYESVIKNRRINFNEDSNEQKDSSAVEIEKNQATSKTYKAKSNSETIKGSEEIQKKKKLSLKDYLYDKVENHNIMPFLNTNLTQKPLMKKLMENAKLRITHGIGEDVFENDSEYESVFDKKMEKNYQNLYEQNSNIWLPSNLPIVEKSIEQDSAIPTNKILPITVKINVPKQTIQQVQTTRVLIAILTALQQEHPDTYIGPIKQNSAKLLHSPTEIPTDEDLLSLYIERSTTNKPRLFFIRIIVHSNHSLTRFKDSSTFRKYIAEENIVLDYNDLESMEPNLVGFLQDIIPRYETVHLHQERVEKMLSKGCPKFQLSIQTLYGRSGERCRVVMINSDKRNVQELKEIFADLHKEECLKFYPWIDFLVLPMELKELAIKKQNIFTNSYRSVLLQGFIDKDNNVPMIMHDEVDESNIEDEMIDVEYQEDFDKIGITEYLSTRIFSGDMTLLFEHVYAPIDGIRETIVRKHHFAEAMEFADKHHGELARFMNQISVSLVFADPAKALN
jgi:hypothetical protein